MKRYKEKLGIQIVGILTVLAFCACGGPAPSGQGGAPVLGEDTQQERVDTGFVVTGPDSYDSADTAILVNKDINDGTVTFLNLILGKRYTLQFDGTTHYYDRYGEGITLEQIEKGAIVDVTFLKSKKHLTSMQLSKDAWSYENVARYDMDPVRGEVAIGTEIFHISNNTQYLSAGRNIDSVDLNPTDTLSFYGIDSEILTIVVEQGHGYLRLVNDENFVGGWIEVGQSQVQQITQDMLLVVPEGAYQVTISHKGGGGTKDVVINRNQETTLDVGDLDVAEVQYGTVLFSMTPSTAKLYIDGAKQDASQPITLEYGIHQLIAKADGYQSVTRYLRVGQASAGVDITLEKSDGTEEESDKKVDDTETTQDKTDRTGEDPDSAGTTTDNDSSKQSMGENTSTEEKTSTKTDTSTDEKTSTKTDTSTEGNTSTEDTATDVLTDYYKVYVDAPEGVEIYLDGNYVGISPCSFRKQSGMHVITLRKVGYETRSYTVSVDNEEKDMSYSFVDLVENKTSE